MGEVLTTPPPRFQTFCLFFPWNKHPYYKSTAFRLRLIVQVQVKHENLWRDPPPPVPYISDHTIYTILVWRAWAKHGSNSTQGPQWCNSLRLFWDPVAWSYHFGKVLSARPRPVLGVDLAGYKSVLCVWRHPRDNTADKRGSWKKEKKTCRLAVFEICQPILFVLCQNPLGKFSDSGIQKFQNPKTKFIQNHKIQTSRIPIGKKNKIRKSLEHHSKPTKSEN